MAATDYYKTLGVSRTASDKEIKSAFRKLARQYHPDVNPGDEEAEQRFKEINEAHEVLGDADNRKKYDKHGENWVHADPHRGDAETGGIRRGARDGRRVSALAGRDRDSPASAIFSGSSSAVAEAGVSRYSASARTATASARRSCRNHAARGVSRHPALDTRAGRRGRNAHDRCADSGGR